MTTDDGAPRGGTPPLINEHDLHEGRTAMNENDQRDERADDDTGREPATQRDTTSGTADSAARTVPVEDDSSGLRLDDADADSVSVEDDASDQNSGSVDADTEVLNDTVGGSRQTHAAASADPSGWPFGTGPVSAAQTADRAAAAPSSPFATGTTATGLATSAMTADVPRPRVRVGAIVWGALVLAFAVAVLLVDGTDAGRSTFDAWQASLTPAGWAVTGIVALGVIVLLIAGTSAIRRAQRHAARR
jgi:hypothetical protein